MTVDLRHARHSGLPASGDPSLMQGSDWDANHILKQGPLALLGRSDATAGQAPTQEIALDVLTMAFVSGQLSCLINWGNLTGKPATFPPTLPILESNVTNLVSDLAAKAPINNPNLTGLATAPTPATGGAHSNDQTIATTAFVQATAAGLVAGGGPPTGAAGGDLLGSNYPNPTIKSSVNLAGSPTTTTPATADATTKIATAAFVKANLANYLPLAGGTLTGPLNATGQQGDFGHVITHDASGVMIKDTGYPVMDFWSNSRPADGGWWRDYIDGTTGIRTIIPVTDAGGSIITTPYSFDRTGFFTTPIMMTRYASYPKLVWHADGNPANTKHWEFRLEAPASGSNSGNLLLYSQDDSNAVVGSWLFERTGSLFGKTEAAGENTIRMASTAFVQAATKAFTACVLGYLSADTPLTNTGTFFAVTGATTGAIGNNGEKWLVEGAATVSNTGATSDFIQVQIWNGSASVELDTVETISGSNVHVTLAGLVTLTGPTTFTLRAKDATSVNGHVVGGYIIAHRVG